MALILAGGSADITVGCVEVPLEEARSFGIVGVDRDGCVRSFIEKPERPPATPGRRNVTLASMGIYVFSRDFLCRWMERDAADPDSTHDFGYSSPQGVLLVTQNREAAKRASSSADRKVA